MICRPTAAESLDGILRKVRHQQPLPVQGVEKMTLGHDCTVVKFESSSGDSRRSNLKLGSEIEESGSAVSETFTPSEDAIRQLEDLLKAYKVRTLQI